MNADDRRLRIALAVEMARQDVDALRSRQTRQEWAASRMADGWSRATVLTAIGAGALATVRMIMTQELPASRRMTEAAFALSLVDSGRHLETRIARWMSDGVEA